MEFKTTNIVLSSNSRFPRSIYNTGLIEDFFKKIVKLEHAEAHKYSEILEHVSSDEIETKINEILDDCDSEKRVVPLSFLKKG